MGFQPNENHRLSVALDDSTLETKGIDLSYALRPYSTANNEKYGERIINDQSKEKIFNLVMKISVKPLFGII